MHHRRAALAVLLLGAACAHAPRRELQAPLAEARCDEALALVLQHPAPPPAADGLRQVVTTPLSWAASGAGWLVDVAAVGALAVGTGVSACLPVFVLEASVGGRGDFSAECFQGVTVAVVEAVPLPGLGKGLHRATLGWRCPDRHRRAAEARAVAGCLARRDGPGDREAAAALLRPLAEPEVSRCLPPWHRDGVRRLLEGLSPPAEPTQEAGPGEGGAETEEAREVGMEPAEAPEVEAL